MSAKNHPKNKFCKSCQRDLAVENYAKNASCKDGLQVCCLECGRERNRASYRQNRSKDPVWLAKNREKCRRYHEKRKAADPNYQDKYAEAIKQSRLKKTLAKHSVAEESYKKQLAAGCAICGRNPHGTESKGRRNRIVFDHDHSTGLFRGLLCSQCNMAIGLMEDNPDRLKAAAQYLVERKQC